MSIFDFLKRKKEVEKAKEKKPGNISAEKKEVKKETKREDLPAQTGKIKPQKSKSVKGFSYEVVREPHIPIGQIEFCFFMLSGHSHLLQRTTLRKFFLPMNYLGTHSSHYFTARFPP